MKIILSRLGRLDISSDTDSNDIAEDGYIKTRVLYCAICRTDAKMWEQGHRDLVFPRVLGHEMVVEDNAGHRYAVWPGKSCGKCRYCLSDRENLCEDMKITGFHSDGGFSNCCMLPEDSLIPLPENMDPLVACFAEPVSCVVNAFEKLEWPKSGRILIYGAGTMGLITALYSRHCGLDPLLIEKTQTKINRIQPFLSAAGIECVKDTKESEFDIVINTCADYIAFCQAITKAAKAGRISFFSGISKNEHIETNLLNLIHYKETQVTGVYGMTRQHMHKALPFIADHSNLLLELIEEIISPMQAPELMPNVLSGRHLKYILDFSTDTPRELSGFQKQSDETASAVCDIDPDRLCGRVIRQIEKLSERLLSQATAKMDNKTKPLGALGRLEPLAIKMSCILDTLEPVIKQKNMLVFSGDHGVTEEGVSAYPSEVTAQMVENFLNGGAAINVLCRHHGIDMKVVDMGVKHTFTPHPDLIIKKVAMGTKNFAIDDAMTPDQALQAVENGMQTFFEIHDQHPIDIIGLGEMGIGNTTSAAAIICTVTGITPSQAAGRGTGVDNKGLAHKIEVIERVLDFHRIDPANGFEILQKIGGYEIAGITGAVLAAASKKCAVVLDGVISTAAGLIAYVINPDIQGYLISGHKSVEISQKAALKHMQLAPLIDFDMRLGEGTGAALAIDMAQAACRIMCEMASFDDAKVARSSL